MELTNMEFYTFEDEVWYRKDNKIFKLEENNRDVIKEMIDTLSSFYPKAYKALEDYYEKLSWNRKLQEYKMVAQFCKCNFGNIDIDSLDIEEERLFHFENVPCPMRGVCNMENKVCHPKFNSILSNSEKRVALLVCKGNSYEQIAKKLFNSERTIKNHIYHSYKKLNISSKAELIDYCRKNNLFSKYEQESL